MASVSGGLPADQPNTPFTTFRDAVTRSDLPRPMAMVLVAILAELDRWSVRDAQAVAGTLPGLPSGDPDRRRAYRLGMAEHVLDAYRRELAALASPRPSPHPST